METGEDDVFRLNVSDQLEQLGMDQLDMNDTVSTNTEARIMKNTTRILESSDEDEPLPAELTKVFLQRRPPYTRTNDPTNQGPAQTTKLCPARGKHWKVIAW